MVVLIAERSPVAWCRMLDLGEANSLFAERVPFADSRCAWVDVRQRRHRNLRPHGWLGRMEHKFQLFPSAPGARWKEYPAAVP